MKMLSVGVIKWYEIIKTMANFWVKWVSGCEPSLTWWEAPVPAPLVFLSLLLRKSLISCTKRKRSLPRKRRQRMMRPTLTKRNAENVAQTRHPNQTCRVQHHQQQHRIASASAHCSFALLCGAGGEENLITTNWVTKIFRMLEKIRRIKWRR